MPAKLDRQFSIMDSLAMRISFEWNLAKNNYKTIGEMHKIYNDIVQNTNYTCLAEKRKETIRFVWGHTRKLTLAKNTIFGRWYKGEFYANWCDLPEQIKYNQTLVDSLPSGHFWIIPETNGEVVTTIRYYISTDSENEDKSHFPE